MRLDPWKLAALVLFVACAHEVAMPDVAHAPGSDDAGFDDASEDTRNGDTPGLEADSAPDAVEPLEDVTPSGADDARPR